MVIILATLVNSNINPVSRWKRFRYRLESFAVGALAWVLPRLSYRVMLRLARAIGFLGYHLLSRPRRIALANLDVAFGNTKSPAEKQRIVLCSMQNFATSMFSLFWSAHLTPETIDRYVELDVASLDFIRKLLSRGKGVIITTLHFGIWELFLICAGYHKLPINIITETMRNHALENIFFRLRSRTGIRIIGQQAAALKLARALQRSECAVLLTDLNAPEEGGGLWLDFFGLPAFSNAAAAGLSLRTGAPVISCSAFPLPDGRVRLTYGPEISFTPTGDYDADLHALSQLILSHCEEVIREHPEFWLWTYKRWKHRRDLDDTRYPFYTTGAVLSLPTRPNKHTNAPHNTTVPANNAPNV